MGVETMNKHLCDFNLPEPMEIDDNDENNIYIEAELSYDQEDLNMYESRIKTFNYEQSSLFKEMKDAIFNKKYKGEKLFLFDALGGTRKTYFSNGLLGYVRNKHKIAIAIATTGIAASLLQGGATAHSTFKIPIDATDKSTCRIPKDSGLAKMIQRASLIIIDEAMMMHKNNLEAIDRSLRDIRARDDDINDMHPEAFGGIVVLFTGNYAQILHVMPRCNTWIIMQNCINRTSFFRETKTLKFQINQRVIKDASCAQFIKWQLDVGYGRNYVDDEDEKVISQLKINGYQWI
jgi:hypothetical protein